MEKNAQSKYYRTRHDTVRAPIGVDENGEETWGPCIAVQCPEGEKDPTKIQNIVDRFKRTGIPWDNKEGAQYGDVTNLNKDLTELIAEKDRVQAELARVKAQQERLDAKQNESNESTNTETTSVDQQTTQVETGE